ncbi:MAG: hypothetical protein WC974_08220 [Thermoplasmata archaeon]
MLFVTLLNIIPGKFQEAIRLIKNPPKTQNIQIKSRVGIFGKPDAIMIFEAKDEQSAVDFVLQFADVASTNTCVAFPADAFKWTQ